MENMTIKQLIKAINENKKTMFDFEGFNEQKHDELVKLLCFKINEKFNSRHLSDNKRLEKASKNIPDLKCYYILNYGIDRPETIDEMYDTELHKSRVMPSIEEKKSRINKVLELLGC